MQLHNGGGGVVATATTDGSGNYSFALNGLGPHTYSVTEVGQPGWAQSRAPGSIVVNVGVGDQNFGGNDFGNYHVASISGQKFEDLNGNGGDNAEPGVPGWPITLTGTNGHGQPVGPTTVNTDGAGNYTFQNLAPGSYAVSEGTMAGWQQTFPPSGSYPVIVTSGQNVTGKDFGNEQTTASISGNKFQDLNANGPDPTDPPVAGWTIELTGTTGAGAAVGPIDIMTDANGNYSFTNLLPGTYALTEGTRPGWGQSWPVPVPPGTYSGINLVSGESKTGYVFGNYLFATVSGQKYEDLNLDGSNDAGTDPGVPGFVIHLDGTDGLGNTVHETQTTDVAGDYLFANVVPGNYTITEDQQPGWHALQGAPGIPVSVVSGDSLTDNEFGNWRNAQVTAEKYEDVNGNGMQDAGEPALAGWTIHLDGADDFGAAVHLAGVTDVSGTYTFTDLVPGHYQLTEELQPGWVAIEPLSGSQPADPLSNGNVGPLKFGNYRPATATAEKYEDLNGNGAQDAGEPGLSGWTIHLDGTDGLGSAVHLTGVTGASGLYTFTQLAPGQYQLTEELQAGWVAIEPQTGSQPADPISNDALGPLKFGNYQPAEIDGSKFEDINRNGARDAGEPTLSGWTITLAGTTGLGAPVTPLTTTTAGDGSYSFVGLAPGQYQVCEVNADPVTWEETMPGPDGTCHHLAVTSHEVSAANDFGNFNRTIVWSKNPPLGQTSSRMGRRRSRSTRSSRTNWTRTASVALPSMFTTTRRCSSSPPSTCRRRSRSSLQPDARSTARFGPRQRCRPRRLRQLGDGRRRPDVGGTRSDGARDAGATRDRFRAGAAE